MQAPPSLPLPPPISAAPPPAAPASTPRRAAPASAGSPSHPGVLQRRRVCPSTPPRRAHDPDTTPAPSPAAGATAAAPRLRPRRCRRRSPPALCCRCRHCFHLAIAAFLPCTLPPPHHPQLGGYRLPALLPVSVRCKATGGGKKGWTCDRTLITSAPGAAWCGVQECWARHSSALLWAEVRVRATLVSCRRTNPQPHVCGTQRVSQTGITVNGWNQAHGVCRASYRERSLLLRGVIMNSLDALHPVSLDAPVPSWVSN